MSIKEQIGVNKRLRDALGFLSLALLLAVIILICLPFWVFATGENEVGLTQRESSLGLVELIKNWLGAGSNFWREVLRSALPTPLGGSLPTLSRVGQALAPGMRAQGIGSPLSFLASAIPMLKYMPDLDSDSLLPPANEPVRRETEVPVLPDSPEVLSAWLKPPRVFIYHTHNVEAFTPSSGKPHVYDDPEQTIVRVGAYLTEKLNAMGMKVTHSRADNIKDNYTAAYNESLKVVTAALAEDPTIEYTLDIHRDAVPRAATTALIEGQSVGKLYFLVGTNEALGHPHWQRNLEFAELLHAKSEELYPGLSRGILKRKTARFNQHVRDNAVLIEIGGDKNSMEEALRTADLLAVILREVIREQQPEKLR